MPQVVGLVTGLFGGGILGSTIVRLLISVAIGAVQSLLAKQKMKKAQAAARNAGISTSTTGGGGDVPLSFLVGRYATAGSFVCPPMSHGTSNERLTYVINLGDVPGQTISRVMINGEYHTIGTPFAGWTEYGDSFVGRLNGYAFIKYYNGSQTVADSMLLSKYGSYPDRPWLSDMIGRNMCYAILTFRYDREVFSSFPQVRFEMNGIPLYDPRADTTVGGSGAQRWNNTATWAYTDNPMVIAYNILRGITLPSIGTWGGEAKDVDLPLANWFAAMNECDVLQDNGAKQYRCGFEINCAAEPLEHLEEIMRSCSGQLVDMGGQWKARAGGPGLPVYFFTDDDVIVTKADELDPFPTQNETFNGITSTYPDPAAMWETVEAPNIYNTTYETADDNRRNMANLPLSAVPFPDQVNRIGQALLKDSRRFLVHQTPLPPSALVLEPLDAVSWTSARNGYASKVFEVRQVTDDLRQMMPTVMLRERDSTDYVWTSVGLPTGYVPPATTIIPGAQTIPGFAVAAFILSDSIPVSRRPALRLTWTIDMPDANGIEYQVRLASAPATVVISGTTSYLLGEHIIADGIIPNQNYQVRGRPIITNRAKAWSSWLSVTSPNVPLTNADLGGVDPEQLFIDAGLSAPIIAGTLPVTGNYIGRLCYLTTDNKLYRWNGSAWVRTTEATDLTGQLLIGQFASTIRPVEVVATLPATGNFAGRMVFLTTDNKLYRHTGSPAGAAGFTLAVDGADIVANSIVAGKIAAGAISATELAANAVVASKVLVSDFNNIYPDFDFEDPDFYSTTSGGVYDFPGVAGPEAVGKRALRLEANAAVRNAFSDWFVIEPSAEFRVSGAARQAVAESASTITLAIDLATVDGSGVITFTRRVNVVVQTNSAAWLSAAVDVVTTATEKRARLAAIRSAGGANNAQVSPLRIQRRANGNLIVDGSITANKIVAGTITGGLLAASAIITNSAQINDALITNSKITGAIQSASFVAGSAGWRADKAGTIECEDIIIRRTLEVASGTVAVADFSPTSTGSGADDDDNELWATIGNTVFERVTGITISAWGGAKKTYLATCGMTGTVARIAGSPVDVYWGWEATLLPLTRWTGDQSLRIRFDFHSRKVLNVTGCTISYKIYEVS